MAERLDGSVLLAGCDKSLPGMMMAAARLDLASVFLYAGSIMPGQVDGHDVTIIDAFEAVGACLAGKITREEVDRIERAICPGEGACGGHVHRQHDGRRRRGDRDEPARLGCPAGRRPASRRLRPPLRRGRGEPAPRGHHRTPDHDHGGVRERDHRRDGPRRLHERRTPPAGDGPRGRRRPHHRRLQPDRRQGAAPRRPQAVRPLRDERRRQGRRHPGRDEGAARRRAHARRRADRHRQDDGGEPRGARAAGTRRRRAALARPARSTRPAG